MRKGISRGHARASGTLLRLGFCAALLLACSCGSGDSAERERGRLTPSVEAVQARHGTLPLRQRLSGVVQAKNQVEIYPQTSAVITEVLVDDGDAVGKGDVLVRLRDTEFRERLKQAEANQRIAAAQLRRAEAQLKEARAEETRLHSLAEKGLASDAELDTAEARGESADADVELARARVEQAVAAVDEQRENLSQTVIRAPVAGHVGERDAEVGMLAKSDTRLFTMGQLDSVRVEIVLTDRMLDYIEKGQRTTVSVAGVTASAPLIRISPFLHPVAHSTEAQIDLANAEGAFKPGMFVTVDVFYGESEEATLVPVSALYENPKTGVMGVYVTRASIDQPALGELGIPESISLTDPLPFEFVPATLVAQGSMAAAVDGVDEGAWVMTVGQNLLAGENGEARVRPVTWERVEKLQRLQREDMMQQVIKTRTPDGTT
jgi:HlyD family secretion protein